MNGSGTCPITNAALVELGVIVYTSIHKGQWFQAGISAAVFLIPQYPANLILGKIEEGGDDETCRPYGLVSFPPLKGSIAQWITVTMNIVPLRWIRKPNGAFSRSPRNTGTDLSGPVPVFWRIFPAEYPAQHVGKPLPVGWHKRRRTSRFDTRSPDLVQKIPRTQGFDNVRRIVDVASRRQDQAPFFHHLGRKGNIGADDQISRVTQTRNFTIGHVKSGGNLYRTNMGGTGKSKTLVGHQDDLDPVPFGGPKKNLLNRFRTCIRIDPDFQKSSLSCRKA